MNLFTSTFRLSRAIFALLPILVIASLSSYNYFMDIYGVFDNRENWRGLVPNERYLKYQSILDRSESIEYLLFGSSRASNIPFSRTKGESAYNFSYSEGLPRDHLQVLEAAIPLLPRLRVVYIAVDEMSYLLDPTPHAQDYLRRQHPDVAGETTLGFLTTYLIRPLSNVDFNYYFGSRMERPDVVYETETSGRSICKECDERIDASPLEHTSQRAFGFPYNPPNIYGIERLVVDLREIEALLTANDIELVLFLNPTYQNNLRWLNLGMLEELKQQLADITDFYDFLVYDARLADAGNFYDVIHYRPMIGQDIMDILIGREKVAAGSFGYGASKNTIRQHNKLVRGKIVGNLITEQKFLRDYDFSRWSAKNPDARQEISRAHKDRRWKSSQVQCRIDSLNRRKFTGDPIHITQDQLSMLELSGWASSDLEGHISNLTIKSMGFWSESRLYNIAAGLRRKDVAARHGEVWLYSGFQSNIDISDLERGNYEIKIEFYGQDVSLTCDQTLMLIIH